MFTDIHTYARKGLEAELVRLDGERERVRALLASLDSAPAGRTAAAPTGQRPRQMSEAGRQAIRDAVKRRWQRVRAAAAGGAQKRAEDGQAESTVAAERPYAQKRTRGAARTGNRKK